MDRCATTTQEGKSSQGPASRVADGRVIWTGWTKPSQAAAGVSYSPVSHQTHHHPHSHWPVRISKPRRSLTSSLALDISQAGVLPVRRSWIARLDADRAQDRTSVLSGVKQYGTMINSTSAGGEHDQQLGYDNYSLQREAEQSQRPRPHLDFQSTSTGPPHTVSYVPANMAPSSSASLNSLCVSETAVPNPRANLLQYQSQSSTQAYYDVVDTNSKTNETPNTADAARDFLSVRTKQKRFDIKISHLSDISVSEPTIVLPSESYVPLDINAGSSGSQHIGSEVGPIRNPRSIKRRAEAEIRIYNADRTMANEAGGISRPTKAKTGKPRERVRIELAPDQPPTTQGKQRERVYVACLQCRNRKIRCDGAKPMCYNCQHRATGACEYDAVPKRRGPDRQPGARQRPGTAPARRSERKSDSHEKSGRSINSRGDSEPSQDGVKETTEEKGDAESTHSTAKEIREDTIIPSQSSSTSYENAASTSAKDNSSLTPSTMIPADSSPWADILPTPAYSTDRSCNQPSQDVPLVGYADIPLTAQEQLFSTAQITGDPTVKNNVTSLPRSQLLPAEQPSLAATSSAISSSPQMLGIPMVHGHTANVAGPSVHNSALYPTISATRRGVYTMSPESSCTSTGSHAEFSSPDMLNTLPLEAQHFSPSPSLQHYHTDTRIPQQLVTHPTIVDGPTPSTYDSFPTQQASVGLVHPEQDVDFSLLTTGSIPVEDQTGCVDYMSYPSAAIVAESFAYNPYQWVVNDPSQGLSARITSVDEDEFERRDTYMSLLQHAHQYSTTITHPPSLSFVRKTWWDSLLDAYCAAPYFTPAIAERTQHLYGLPFEIRPGSSFSPSAVYPARQQAVHIISKDIQFLFKNSNFWFAFINVPLFFKTFFDPEQREDMQPALVLAALTMSTFLRSSEAELGEEGRRRTLWLREMAQAALEASAAGARIDPGLAQAAWLLTLFEISAHPSRSLPRTESAFTNLDNIIRVLALTYIDAEDPTTRTAAASFTPHSPQMQNNHHHRQPQSHSHIFPLPLYNDTGAGVHALQPQSQNASQLLQYQTVPSSQSQQNCACVELSLGRNWPEAQEHTPLWLCTPAWDPDWSIAEIRREECRRLCWNALTIAAGYTTYRSAVGMVNHDMSILQPANFRLLFPGENLSGLSSLSAPGSYSYTAGFYHAARETVWVLYARAMLLWVACVRVRAEQSVDDHERAVFAGAVWREADAIENALDGHSCQTERAFLYSGREYLFNARMYVSYEFRRFVPHPSPELSGSVHRRKAEEWLVHQATVSKRIMKGLQTVTGLKNNVLAKRPFFIFWFMGQISRCLQLWSLDKGLTVAIQLSKEFLPPIDYLTALWPCEDQRTSYAKIRLRLEQACLEVGIDPPPPPNLIFPPPSSPLVLP